MIQRFLKKPHFITASRISFWFFLGATLGLFFFASFVFILYQKSYSKVIYPGVFVDGIDFSGKSKEDVKQHFSSINNRVADTKFFFVVDEQTATVSAKEIDLGYDDELLADQAYSLGRSHSLLSDISIIFQAYLNGIYLPPSYRYKADVIKQALAPIQKTVNTKPIDALFTFENGRVSAFQLSKNGKEVAVSSAIRELEIRRLSVLRAKSPQTIRITVPVKTVKPKVTTEEANDMGVKELVGRGTSLFVGSIPNRIYNLTLAAARLNGVIIAPGEVFSFNKAVGDVSSLTGYKQAYVIQNGRTVLGDGGGVCQVSTTFFRAILDAGYPVIERNAHAYRVHYYEEDSGPGIDAAIYTPTVDLKFKNDSGHALLVQSYVNPDEMRLTFEFYGTKDGREVIMNKPVIISQTPAPEPLFQDDPTLPKGTVKQVDFAAAGARVYFTREVKKNGKVVIADKFVSNYRPWQAIFLRGTKE